MIHDMCNGGCEHCPEKPELLYESPIGQYHCPYCMMMVCAAVTHPTCDDFRGPWPANSDLCPTCGGERMVMEYGGSPDLCPDCRDGTKTSYDEVAWERNLGC